MHDALYRETPSEGFFKESLSASIKKQRKNPYNTKKGQKRTEKAKKKNN